MPTKTRSDRDIAVEALATMKQHQVRRLPVIDGTDGVDIISQGDLVNNLSRTKAGDLVQTISDGA